MSRTALVLIAHGARDPEWASPLKRVCTAIAERAPSLRIELAFLDFMAPTLQDSAERLIAEGFKHIVVLPMFIAQGGHLKRDVPLLLDELRARHPEIRFEQASPVGEAESIVQAMVTHVLTLAGE